MGTGRQTSLLMLLDALNKLIGTGIKPDFAAARAGDVRHSLADIGLASKILGYGPEHSLEQGLSELLAWRRA